MGMDATLFENLVREVTPLLLKEDTPIRRVISPAEKLALILPYLASGESFKSLSFQFRIGVSAFPRSDRHLPLLVQ